MANASAAAPISENTIYQGRPAALDSLWRWFWSVVTLSLLAWVWWFKAIGLHLKVTDQRLIVRRGILSRTTEYIELYRVNDLQVEEPLFERMFGYGRLLVSSTDRSAGMLVLRGFKQPTELADRIRAGVEQARRRRGIATIVEA